MSSLLLFIPNQLVSLSKQDEELLDCKQNLSSFLCSAALKLVGMPLPPCMLQYLFYARASQLHAIQRNDLVRTVVQSFGYFAITFAMNLG